jgi:hypothetical protein
MEPGFKWMPGTFPGEPCAGCGYKKRADEDDRLRKVVRECVSEALPMPEPVALKKQSEHDANLEHNEIEQKYRPTKKFGQ